MSVQPIPPGYHTITPYLVVDDVAREVEFLTRAFEAKLRHKNEDGAGEIVHAELELGDSRVMAGKSSGPNRPTRAMLYLYVADTDSLYASALLAGAKSVLAPSDQFYGDRIAGVADPFGNEWWLATHVEDVSDEELRRRMGGAAAK